jgi:hypothetical protein
MLKRLLLGGLFIFCLSFTRAQDVLYLNDGTKFTAIVTEINPTEIKYKSTTAPNGPVYIISKSDVLLIEYKSGEIEIINKNPKPYPDKKTDFPVYTTKTSNAPPSKQSSKVKDTDLRYLHKSTFMINGLALANADITFLFDHEFADSHLSVTLLGGYNFNRAATWPNAIIQAYLEGAKKNYDLGLGFNYYPSNKKKTQYFMGLWFKYMSYNYLKEIQVTEVVNGTVYNRTQFEPRQSYQLATLFVNGFQIRISPFVNYKLFVGIGGYNPQPDLREAIKNKYPQFEVGTQVKMYAGMCFGYRF